MTRNVFNFKLPRSVSSNTTAGQFTSDITKNYNYIRPNAILYLTGGTFSRASTATYRTGSNIGEASVSELRLEEIDDGNGTMVMLEAEKTKNHVPYSELLSTWSVTESGASVIDSVEDSPLSGIQASKVSFSSSSSSRIRELMSAASHESVDFNVSAWIKLLGGAPGQIRLSIRKPDATFATAQSFTLSGDWQRISGVFWNSSSLGPSDPQIVIQNGSDGLARDIAVWGVQVEQCFSGTIVNSPQSYIRTSGTAIERSPDSLLFSSGSYPESFLTEGFIIQHAPFKSSTDMARSYASAGWIDSQCIVGIGNSGSMLKFLSDATGVKLAVQSDGILKITSSYLGFPADRMLTITVRPDSGLLKVSNANSGDGTYLSSSFSFSSGGNFSIGQTAQGASSGSNGRYGLTIVKDVY